ncbi:MAG TPA: response regulator [Myxococcota bacterium]|nr:response regulator [Myxococcota bacterium]
MQPPTPPAAPVRLGRTTVVVADRDAGVRESLRMILGPHHRVYTASCADALFDLLVRGRVNCVVLDLRLPGGRPAELLEGLRREFPEVALVVLTNTVTLEEASAALRSGVSDLLRKPFDVMEVGAAVARAVGAQRQRARLVSFLRALGQTLGKQRQVQDILLEVEETPPLRQRLSDLVSRAARPAATHRRLREASRVAGSAQQGAWS